MQFVFIEYQVEGTHLTFRDMRILDMRLFVYKHTETIEYVKKYPTFYLRKIRTLRANNSTTLRIQNATFSECCFYMNTNLWRDFRIYISVPLIF